MPSDRLISLAIALRGVRPGVCLPFVQGRQIVLVHGLQPAALAMAAGCLSLAVLFWNHAPTLVGQAVALALVLMSLPLLPRIVLSILVPTARLEPGGVELARLPLITLRRHWFPAEAFRLVLHPWHWSRSYGRGPRRRIETAQGWAFVLERPRMLPIVLELRWQGSAPEALRNQETAEARAEELRRTLGLAR